MTKYFYTVEALRPEDHKANTKELIINGIQKDNILEINTWFNSYDEALNHAEKQKSDPKLKYVMVNVYSCSDDTTLKDQSEHSEALS